MVINNNKISEETTAMMNEDHYYIKTVTYDDSDDMDLSSHLQQLHPSKKHNADNSVVVSKRVDVPNNDKTLLSQITPKLRMVHFETNGSIPPPSVLSSDRGVVPRRTVAPLSNPTKPLPPDHSAILPFERPFYRDCHYISNWTIRPTCNILHELPTSDLSLLSTKGSWRSVWKYENNGTAVVKRLRLDREWNQEAYDRHDTDALALERLTSSSHVCTMYAVCGPSVVTEKATGSARYFLKNPNLTALHRLELGRDLATVIAQVHAANLVHNDLNIANLLEVHGTLKLNDFNIGIRMRQFQNGTVCKIPARFEAPLWKSPEEIRNTSYVDGYSTDVYGLGNLLFQVLTKRQPWTHLEEPVVLNKTQVAEKKLKGGLPNLPKRYTEYSGASTILGQAAMACFRMEKRPTAKTVADLLASAVRYFKAHPNTYLDLPSNLFDQ